MTRRLTTLCAVALGLSLGATAAADPLPQGGGTNNVVIAQTTADGAQRVRAHTKIAQIGGPNVATANIATATATGCTGCEATAVAVQVVLVTGSPQYFAPGNAAVSVNSGCTACGTFAHAWQYVLQVDGPAHLSPRAGAMPTRSSSRSTTRRRRCRGDARGRPCAAGAARCADVAAPGRHRQRGPAGERAGGRTAGDPRTV